MVSDGFLPMRIVKQIERGDAVAMIAIRRTNIGLGVLVNSGGGKGSARRVSSREGTRPRNQVG